MAAVKKLKKENQKEGRTLVTKSVSSAEEAIEAKMKAIEPKLLGVKLVKYRPGEKRRVWIPYYFFIYDYKVKRNLVMRDKELFARSGQVAVVYDANEMHASHYDLIADGEIPLIKKDINDDGGVILPDAGTMEEVISNAERSIQRQILFKAYKSEGELSLVKAVKFYREAWELQVFYKDREFIKYAYLDAYGVSNERARGLRARMDNV